LQKTFIAAALGLVLLAGCTTNQNQNVKAYPTEAKDSFVNSCAAAAQKAGGGDIAKHRTDCRCIVNALEKTVPYQQQGASNDFRDADTLTREGKTLPTSLKDKFDTATASCVASR
jgi:hypothetical protein